jgi:hypothetical protein
VYSSSYMFHHSLIIMSQAGGVFVDCAMEKLLKEKLTGSKFCDDQIIADIVNGFEKKVSNQTT